MTPRQRLSVFAARDVVPGLALLAALGVLAGLTETFVPDIVGVVFPPMNIAHVLMGLLAVAVALKLADRMCTLPWRRPETTIGLAFLLCLAAGWLGGVSWPNSGDEFSDLFLTDTLLAGRLWNPAPPDPWLFESAHVLVNEGKAFSPYPPAWSALLAPFRTLHAIWLAAPLMTLLLGIALRGACLRLQVSPVAQNAALALVLLTPFATFLGGSLFPQTMSAALVACIVWAQLTDDARPRVVHKLLIGALFGVLMMTRYEVMPLVLAPYLVDRLVRRRLAAVADAAPVMLGLLPFVAASAAYNWGITGNPLQMTAQWVGPVTPGSIAEAELYEPLDPGASQRWLYWLGSLAQFGGFPVLVLAVAALAVKCRRRSWRFYDALLPIALVFYEFVPFTGGNQYGPRYWFWAWPAAVLTIVTSLVDQAGDLTLWRRRVRFGGFAAASLAYAAAAFCVLLTTTHTYIASRREAYGAIPPSARSVVMLPVRLVMLWPWQLGPLGYYPNDFTRNGIGFDSPILYVRGDVPDAVSRACRLSRPVFRWEEPGRLLPVACPAPVK
jgi:hypothetical protein